jgi:GNAT superfamily N-acetyltransferase
VSTRVAIDVRPYRDEDEPAVLALLDASLGGGPAGRRSTAFLRWKHRSNPFGPSYAILAERDGEVVGFRTFMRWRFLLDGRPVAAVRAVDTATHPACQGQGIFRRLTLAALEDLGEDTDLVFNTPNAKSLPGYLTMGWQRVSDVPIRVRVRRPLAFARNVSARDDAPGPSRPAPSISARSASEVLAVAGLERLLPPTLPGRLATDRSPSYLRWRYAQAPDLDYRAVTVGDPAAPDGVALFRVRPRGRLWETTVAEVLAVPGERTAVRRVLRAAVRAAAVDHVTCSFPEGSEGLHAARRVGFWPSPGGLTLVANPLRPLGVDPLAPSSWALALGDLEVF